MNGVVWCHPAGSKLGNASMCWLFAYAHAQRVGAEFVCSPWIGEDIFSLPKYGRPTKACEQFPVFSEMNLCEDYTNIRITAYAQSEKATRLYTREQAREWLQLRLDPHDLLAAFASGPQYRVVGHLRRGDFVGYSGYPLVSLGSYERCIATFKLNAHLSANFETFLLVSELCPRYITVLPKHLSFLPDFMTLVTAPILLRANSSFSWVAGLLNTGRVFSPIITQRMRGAVDNDCEFVESNHPRLTWIEGCGDLRLKGQP